MNAEIARGRTRGERNPPGSRKTLDSRPKGDDSRTGMGEAFDGIEGLLRNVVVSSSPAFRSGHSRPLHQHFRLGLHILQDLLFSTNMSLIRGFEDDAASAESQKNRLIKEIYNKRPLQALLRKEHNSEPATAAKG